LDSYFKKASWDNKKALDLMKKCKNKKEFQIKYAAAHAWVRRNNKLLLDKHFGANFHWTEEKAIETLEKIKTLTELHSFHRGLWDWIVRNDKQSLVKIESVNVTRKKGYWNADNSVKEAKKYKTRTEFQNNSSGAYEWLMRYKKLHLLDGFMPIKISSTYIKESILDKVS